MKILYGIKNGALLQRNAGNVSETILAAEVNGTLRAAPGSVEPVPGGLWKLTGIPVGGPYTVTLSDDESSVTLTDVYVGDLWLLGGQSNMEGVGRLTDEDRAYAEHPDPDIRQYGFSDEWSPAVPRLHRFMDAKTDVPTRRFWQNCLDQWAKMQCPTDEYPNERVRCVGPGLFFAQRMRALTGVPQGVIPTGFGGASIEDWNAGREDSFCATAVSRMKLCGGRVKGLFWYQGESDAMIGTPLDVFLDKYRKILSAFGPFAGGIIPTVQVQIAAVHAFGGDPGANDRWSRIKDLQYRMDGMIDQMATVSALDGQLEDLIHLTSDSQKRVGRRAADAMFRMLTTGDSGLPAVAEVTLEPDELTPFWRNIRIRYKNTGALRFVGVAYGYALRRADSADVPNMSGMGRMWTEGDCVIIRTELPEEKLREKELWYAWGSEAIGTLVCENGEPLPVHMIRL